MDLGQDPFRRLPNTPKDRWVVVVSFGEAAELCRAYAARHGLHPQNWIGGLVLEDQQSVAYIDTSGQLWSSHPAEGRPHRIELRAVA